MIEKKRYAAWILKKHQCSCRKAIQTNLEIWMDDFVTRGASEMKPAVAQTSVGQ